MEVCGLVGCPVDCMGGKEMAVYFSGRKKIGQLSVVLDSDRARIDCTIFEKWIDIDTSTTVRCGAPGTCVVAKTEGIAEKTTQTVERSIGTSLGLDDILKLKASIKDVFGYEVNWNHSITTTKTFNFEAPACGRYSLVVYQLVREYELIYFRQRRWTFRQDAWDKKWSRTIPEHTNTHDALPDVEEFDETCKSRPECKAREAMPNIYDGLLCFDMGKASFRVPYRLTSDGFEVQILKRIISFTFADYPAGVRGLEQGLTISVPVQVIPEPLVFLSDIKGEYAEAQVFRYIDPDEDQSRLPEEILTGITTLKDILALAGQERR
jgi:hypothetical protein